MTLRIALIDDQTGECEIGGQRCKVVPVEPTDEMVDAAWDSDGTDYVGEHHRIWSAGHAYRAMLSAADIDLSALPVVPERLKSPPFGWLPDDGGEEYAQAYNAALDAMGVK